jgi:hypothetical protein
VVSYKTIQRLMICDVKKKSITCTGDRVEFDDCFVLRDSFD